MPLRIDTRKDRMPEEIWIARVWSVKEARGPLEVEVMESK